MSRLEIDDSERGPTPWTPATAQSRPGAEAHPLFAVVSRLVPRQRFCQLRILPRAATDRPLNHIHLAPDRAATYTPAASVASARLACAAMYRP